MKREAAPLRPGERPQKPGLHPRNLHKSGYDFSRLIRSCPELAPFLKETPYGGTSVDFADPQAVKALNRALLQHHYGVANWDLPAGYLCPPIPGRADYLHHLADLLAGSNGGRIPRGEGIRVLDIGVGASGIYPLLGNHEYGWRFIGSDIDPKALRALDLILEFNHLNKVIQLRRQPSPENCFRGVVKAGELFDLSMCNPPFHGFAEEAQAGSLRKAKNLGLLAKPKSPPVLNFGGQGNELWCPGGEASFVRRMILESADFAGQFCWLSTLVSKESNLPGIYRALKKAGAVDHRTLPMAHGQKKSRIVAWTFLGEGQRRDWRETRWRVSPP